MKETARSWTSPHLLSGLLEAQPGAVVSRVLLKKKTGNVSLFAFDAGEGLSEHTAPFDALVYAVSGEATVTLGTERHPLAEGAFLIFPANVPHAVEAQTPFKMLLVMLRA